MNNEQTNKQTNRKQKRTSRKSPCPSSEGPGWSTNSPATHWQASPLCVAFGPGRPNSKWNRLREILRPVLGLHCRLCPTKYLHLVLQNSFCKCRKYLIQTESNRPSRSAQESLYAQAVVDSSMMDWTDSIQSKIQFNHLPTRMTRCSNVVFSLK